MGGYMVGKWNLMNGGVVWQCWAYSCEEFSTIGSRLESLDLVLGYISVLIQILSMISILHRSKGIDDYCWCIDVLFHPSLARSSFIGSTYIHTVHTFHMYLVHMCIHTNIHSCSLTLCVKWYILMTFFFCWLQLMQITRNPVSNTHIEQSATCSNDTHTHTHTHGEQRFLWHPLGFRVTPLSSLPCI